MQAELGRGLRVVMVGALIGTMFVVLAPGLAAKAAGRRGGQRPVARIGVSARVVGWRQVLTANATGSKLGRGGRLRFARVWFGDGSRPVTLRSLRTDARHRYANRGRYRVRLELVERGGLRAQAARVVLVTSRLGIRLRPNALDTASARVASILAVPHSASRVLILTSGSRVPWRGQVLVVRPGGVLPQGFLGRVEGASRNADGSVTVTAQPSDLGAAYSRFSVAVENELGVDKVFLVDAVASANGGPRARAASASAIPFTCQTSAGWNVDATADFSHTHVDATLDIASRAIHFLFTSDPTFTLGLSFTGSAKCTLRNANELQITLPVAAPMTLSIRPEFELDANGSFTATATWSPRFAIGFDRAPGIDQNAIGFGSGFAIDSSGQADADLYAGLAVELGLAGRVGVVGSIGPHLHAHLTESSHDAQLSACATVTAWLHAQLSANADVFIKHWSWTLYSGDFDQTTLYDRCASLGGSGSGGGGNVSGGGGSGGGGSAGGSSSGGGGSGGGTSPPPPPPPASWAETTGGVTHTWTNYTNAGGVEGPSIPSNQTVQIACKVSGFRVEDGNTWWYRIASSPWSDAYYASADAFYNNGQTSGSLLGTPFVDPNVPNC